MNMSTIFVQQLVLTNKKWFNFIKFSFKKKQETLVREANAAIMKYKDAYEANKKKDTSED